MPTINRLAVENKPIYVRKSNGNLLARFNTLDIPRNSTQQNQQQQQSRTFVTGSIPNNYTQ
jgi:hypothetical protein